MLVHVIVIVIYFGLFMVNNDKSRLPSGQLLPVHHCLRGHLKWPPLPPLSPYCTNTLCTHYSYYHCYTLSHTSLVIHLSPIDRIIIIIMTSAALLGPLLHSQDFWPIRTSAALSGPLLHSQDLWSNRTSAVLSGPLLHSQDLWPIRTSAALSGPLLHSQDLWPIMTSAALSGPLLHSRDYI